MLRRKLFGLALVSLVTLCAGCIGSPEDVGLSEEEVLTPDLTAYPSSGGVVVDYTGMSGGPQDWIAIAPVGAPLHGYVNWARTTGVNGSVFIPYIPPGGPYEARAYYDQTVGVLRQTSAPFSTMPSATVTTDSGSYVSGTTITVTYNNVPASTNTWFTLAPQGSSLTTITDFRWSNGSASGSFTFGAPATAGSYVIRCFRDASYVLVVESAPFAVTAPSSMASLSVPAIIDPGAPIPVTYSGFLGSGEDWISIASPGDPPNSSWAVYYPLSGTSGMVTFNTVLAPGTYQARGFFNWSAASQRYVIRATATFTIAAATDRASVSSTSAEGNDLSSFGAISSDAAGARYVTFESRATNLVAGDTNGVADIFLRDRQTGTTTRVSVNSAGVQSDGTSSKPRVSSDGRYVVFSSRGTNLAGAPDPEFDLDVFVRDTVSGTTSCASVTPAGVPGNDQSFYPSITSDGRYVVFHSAASDLVAGDTNGQWDVFVRDLVAGTTERVSVSSSGAQANGISQFGRISDDGRYVVFISNATNIVAGKTNTYFEVFLRDRVAGTTTRITNATSGEVNADSYAVPEISGNGDFVVFSSWASNLVAGDTNALYDAFLWNRVQGTILRVNVASDGTQANARVYNEGMGVSNDGRYVVYSSAATNLVAGDTNGVEDVFVRDTALGTTTRVSVDGSGAQGNGASLRPLISADGRRIVFESAASNLVSGDTNGAIDVFVRFN